MSEGETPNPAAGKEASGPEGHGDARWLDRPGSVDWIVRILVVVSLLTVVADLFYAKHGEYPFQEIFGFDAAYGFVSCVGLVLLAKGLRVLLMRTESYYD